MVAGVAGFSIAVPACGARSGLSVVGDEDEDAPMGASARDASRHVEASVVDAHTGEVRPRVDGAADGPRGVDGSTDGPADVATDRRTRLDGGAADVVVERSLEGGATDARPARLFPVAVTAGNSRTCARLPLGNVRCWGYGPYLGYGNTNNVGDHQTPASAGDVDVGGPVQRIVSGRGETCAILDTGGLRCWGSGDSGRLGYGNHNTVGDNETPASVGDVPLHATAVDVAVGGDYACAVLDTGAVRCWGRSGYYDASLGIVGVGLTQETPDVAVQVGGRVQQIVAGGHHTCALLEGGRVRCWGNGDNGELGYGNAANVGFLNTPASAGDVDVGGTVTQLAAGDYHTCALLDTGSVRCWGIGTLGDLGYGNIDTVGDDETPASVGDVNVGGAAAQIAAGGDHTCALLRSGSVRCWGDGVHGELGYGNTNIVGEHETPADVGDVNVGGKVVQVSVGVRHTCAVLETGGIRCWGQNDVGQLGYGNTDDIGDNEAPAAAGDVPVE